MTCVKNCMNYEVEGIRPREIGWREIRYRLGKKTVRSITNYYV